MSPKRPGEAPGSPRRLRLWPAVLVVALQLAAMYGPTLLLELRAQPTVDASGVAVESSFVDNPQVVLIGKALGPLVGTILLLLWWVGFSRAPWKSRILGPLALAALVVGSWKLRHSTMDFGFVLYALPTATTAGLLALLLFRRAPFLRRGLIALGAIALVFGLWTGVRMDGVDGDLGAQLSWRWAKTSEERLLAERQGAAPSQPLPSPETLSITDTDWPGYRGAQRDGRVSGLRVRADWPDEGLPELWRTPMGPGWSSFAVVGETIFTQEQRGDREVVTAYDATDGRQIWEHAEEARFQEFISGAGPRATPAFAAGRLYAVGARGKVNCLDPRTGSGIWQRDLVEDTGAGVPMWGFASSPLVHDGLVVVFAGAGSGKSLIAYDAESGEPRWTAGNGLLSYSSAHLARLHDVTQILLMTELGLASFAPDTGEQLWLHEWPLGGGSPRIVQPAVIGNDVVIGTGYGYGSRRISVAYDGVKWSTEELWTSSALKPYHNDFVVVGEIAFGFDGSIFSAVDLDTGKRLWKRGRYGSGQVLLVADQGLLIVLSEKGELVLLEADPRVHKELARFQALEGKTWNHPVLAGGRLFVRNGTEAASFDLRESSR